MSKAPSATWGPVRDETDNQQDNTHERDGAEDMTITTAPPPHATWFDDAHDVIDVTRRSPGLPIPTISPARATFDYRHIVHADAARESVACAVTILAAAFGTMFASRAEMAGDDTPRYLLVALLPSGLTVVIISRVEYDLDAAADREDAAQLVSAA